MTALLTPRDGTATPVTPSGTPPTLSTAGLLTALSALLMSVLSFSATSVGLHDIGLALGASPASQSLVMAAYSVGFATLMVVGGRLGDLYGRRLLFLIGMIAFTLTSVLATMSPDVGVLIAARAAMGLSAAMMVPQVLATITAATSGTARSRAVALFGATAGGGTALGQVLGGLLLSGNVFGLGWRAVFAFAIPFGVVATLAALRWMPETRQPGHRHLDLVGTALLGISLVTLMLPLAEGSALGWPWWCWVSLAASGVFGWAFWRTQQRLHRAGTPPLVPPPLLRLRSYRLGLVLALILMSGYGAFTYEYTLVTQTGLGWLPLHAALVTLPFALVFLTVSIASGRLVPRFGGRRILAIGGLVQLVGLVAIALVSLIEAGGLGSISLGATMFVMGIGQAMMLGPLVGVILAQVPASSAGAGSGVFTTVQQGSLALGVAALGAVFVAVAQPGSGAVQPSHFTVAFAVCLGIQALGSIVFTVTALRLPRSDA